VICTWAHTLRNSKTIVPRDGPKAKEPDALDLDRSGHAILALLEEAAQVARMNEDRATGMAQRLSKELEAVVERTRQIEAELRRYEDRAFRAEKWLLQVYKEIESKFFNQNTAANSGQSAPR
jgi:hypothetical protein